ncbi:MAG: hypothetical protein EAZ74_06070 [Alphaproteobacteria bacterium]|nr:MAG: hypothetical protein EAY76_05790 [Alphaproteobacteria bacterium]TAF13267.1 MAG: hypothetical protein EAZ74_06070 [Alphaproteobacteria bacterium]TAF38294.1 MAG: hypothetical protein EAZ66_06550 [Alphaproteobacteria bacterium]TAF77318.1 MAG: hypothetical protein EAZ52_00775 [Alphaproteobacteria bacterium]
MPWTLQQVSEHGVDNPIVARLCLQVVSLLNQCNITSENKEYIVDIYMNSLMKKLLRCHEIFCRYRDSFNNAVISYQRPTMPTQPVEIPVIPRLEEECHNFLYEAKNTIRDTLLIFNRFYGTSFEEASEVYAARRQGQSLIDYINQAFGQQDDRTIYLAQFTTNLEYIVRHRNAIEHPNGHSGTLMIKNFEIRPDGTLNVPCWWREKNSQKLSDVHHMGYDFDSIISDLLNLAEFIFISWARNNLIHPDIQLAYIPENMRHPHHPVHWDITLRDELIAQLPQ